MTVTGGFPAPGPQDRDQRDTGRMPGRRQPVSRCSQRSRGNSSRCSRHTSRASCRFGHCSSVTSWTARSRPFASTRSRWSACRRWCWPPSWSRRLRWESARPISRPTFLSRFGSQAQAFLGVPASLLQASATALATTILSGLLIHVVGQAVLGRKPDLGQTWRSTRGRVPSLLALSFLSGLFGLLSTALLIGPGVLLLVNDNIGAGVILLLLGLLGLIAVALAVSTKISMAAPAIVLEGHGVLAGLRRSFALTKGAAFWRVLGITLVAGILAGIAGWLLGLPFSLIGIGIAAMAGQDTETRADGRHVRLAPVGVALGGDHDTLRGGRDRPALHRPPDAPRRRSTWCCSARPRPTLHRGSEARSR